MATFEIPNLTVEDLSNQNITPIDALRGIRSQHLEATDKYFSISDATFPNVNLLVMRDFRHQLRDITKNCKPEFDLSGNLVVDYYPSHPL
jgi:hypothetical protein